MAQFTLNWSNIKVLTNPNAIGQRVSYRERLIGDPWIDTGFDPTNDLGTDAETADSPDTLDDNKVYEFKVETLCTTNGPTINDNDIQEAINFDCLEPTLENTETTSDITLDVTDTDIAKAKFTLRKASDNSVIVTSAKILRSGDSITYGATGLTGGVNYYWQVDMYALVNNVYVDSSTEGYLGELCSPYSFTTDEPPTCDPVISVEVSSIEIT